MGGRGSEGMVPAMPPGLQHWHVVCPTRHRTDTLRRLIHALNAQRVLVFMNWQSRLQVWCEGGRFKSVDSETVWGLDLGRTKQRGPRTLQQQAEASIVVHPGMWGTLCSTAHSKHLSSDVKD